MKRGNLSTNKGLVVNPMTMLKCQRKMFSASKDIIDVAKVFLTYE